MKLKIMAAVLCFTLLSGCGESEPEITEPAVEASAEATVAPEPLKEEKPAVNDTNEFIEKYVETKERPVGVMIDNDDKNARPQAGIEDAYLVYEVVVEGGATRFLALFRSDDVKKIGPVRSSRHYFLDFALENDVIYTHFGWSPKASADIPALGVKNINGIQGGDDAVFWREQKFKGDWHSAYTSIEKIRKRADAKGYAAETDRKNGIAYSVEEVNLSPENKASEIKLPYSGRYSTGYTYNPENGLYEKTIGGAPHKMQSGAVLSFKNVIVVLVSDTDLGDGSARRNINTSGSGKGYYFTNGCYEEITWSKPSRNGNTVYKKANDEELSINTGKTVINLISPSLGVEIK